jgi:hypothetical protein
MFLPGFFQVRDLRKWIRQRGKRLVEGAIVWLGIIADVPRREAQRALHCSAFVHRRLCHEVERAGTSGPTLEPERTRRMSTSPQIDMPDHPAL